VFGVVWGVFGVGVGCSVGVLGLVWTRVVGVGLPRSGVYGVVSGFEGSFTVGCVALHVFGLSLLECSGVVAYMTPVCE
jgi:hypothetical protein